MHNKNDGQGFTDDVDKDCAEKDLTLQTPVEVISSTGHHRLEEIQWECPDQAGSDSIIL